MITVQIDEDQAEEVIRKLLQEDMANIISDYANGAVIFSYKHKQETRKVKKLIRAYRRVLKHYEVRA